MSSLATVVLRWLLHRLPIRRLRSAAEATISALRTLMVALTRHVQHPAVLATVFLLILTGTLIRVASSAPRTGPNANTPQVFGIGGGGTTATVPEFGPAVEPLRVRYSSDVLVTSTRSLTTAQVTAARAAAGNGASIQVSLGRVNIGRGVTQAIGIDPSSFRSFTPRGTADSTPLWESIAGGDAAVAHTVARALAVPLGGEIIVDTRVGHARLRVGAFATTGLPGIGMLLNASAARTLGLIPRAGLILSVRGQDPAVATSLIRDALPGLSVLPVHVALSQDGRLAWVPPCIGPITSGFGQRDGGFHDGMDIGAAFGAPIYAAADGYVLYAGPASGFGYEVVLQHAGNVVTVYGHMERILVNYGFVKAGTAIALVGSEGDSTGPHLHFEVHLNDRAIDPYYWLRDHGVTFS